MEEMCKREQLIRNLQERLNWLINDAADEEFDAGEIRGIIDSLRVMNPLKEEDLTAEKGLARFWKMLELEELLEQETVRPGIEKPEDEKILKTL